MIYYINIKFQTYQDIFVAQERNRIKRKSNDSENIEMSEKKENKTKLEGPGELEARPEGKGREEKYGRKDKYNAGAGRNEGFNETSLLRSLLILTEQPAHNFIPTFRANVESFSFYLNKDRKLDKGPKVEINSYSQVTEKFVNFAEMDLF